MIRIKASVNIRLPSGRFPASSHAAVLVQAREDLKRDTERAFAAKVDPVTGRAWPERKTVRANPLLELSGRMKRAALTAVAAAVINGNTVIFRQSSPRYAKWQFGGTKRIQARRFIGASPTTKAAIRRRLQQEGLKVFGRREVS